MDDGEKEDCPTVTLLFLIDWKENITSALNLVDRLYAPEYSPAYNIRVVTSDSRVYGAGLLLISHEQCLDESSVFQLHFYY